jgi:hypothetical protein
MSNPSIDAPPRFGRGFGGCPFAMRIALMRSHLHRAASSAASIIASNPNSLGTAITS